MRFASTEHRPPGQPTGNPVFFPANNRLLITCAGTIVALSGVSLWPTCWLKWLSRKKIFFQSSELDYCPTAIVPGAFVDGHGQPSLTLVDRLEAAASLFSAGKVDRILVSGGLTPEGVDEVDTMIRWLRQNGIAPDKIEADHAGYRTRQTMINASKKFGIHRAIICSQYFHLPRCLFLAQNSGIDAVGMVADKRKYKHHLYNLAREQLAISRAIMEVVMEKRGH